MPPSKRRGAASSSQKGFIRCYGLFWSAGEIDWFPGPGNKGRFRLLGRLGKNLPTLKVCDFRPQTGIYAMYDDYGPYYVGLTRKTPIGDRLKQHQRDHHAGRWDRFSWFGFRAVQKGCLPDGTRGLGQVPKQLLTDTTSTIGDIEALLIQSLGTQHRGNKVQMRFAVANPWEQVMAHEAEDLLAKL